MIGKKKRQFKPVITRVKLNPEQAVLTCDCFDCGVLGFTFMFGKYTPSGCDSFRGFAGNFTVQTSGSAAHS